MRALSRFSVLALFALLGALNPTTREVVSAPASKTAKPKPEPTAPAGLRSMTFPGDIAFGTLYLVRPERRALHGLRRIAAARGAVVVDVPPEALLMYQAGQKVLLQPALINSLPVAGIDVVHFGFMSMDTNEDGICDRAVKFAPHFVNCSYLNVANSDCSDAGIDQIKSMPSLKGLWASLSGLRGRCLKTLDRFPNLEEVDLSQCAPFDLSRLVNLNKIPHLKRLYLNDTGINNDSVQILASCKSLETLEIRGNKKVDDNCLPYIASMKSLSDLSLSGTAISTKGLEQLAKLHLKHLLLPKASYAESEHAHLKKMFPGVKLAIKDTSREREETKMVKESKMFAPLRN